MVLQNVFTGCLSIDLVQTSEMVNIALSGILRSSKLIKTISQWEDVIFIYMCDIMFDIILLKLLLKFVGVHVWPNLFFGSLRNSLEIILLFGNIRLVCRWLLRIFGKWLDIIRIDMKCQKEITWSLEIRNSPCMLKKISQVSAAVTSEVFFNNQREILYLRIAM